MNTFKNILTNSKKVHFIGIGGVSMSALAQLTLNMGKKVSGSDAHLSSEVNKLRSLGISVSVGHRSKNITGVDLVVYTGAINEKNVELCAARKNGIPTIERGKYLGLIAQDYQNVIAISGAHGKTTTTAMIAQTLIKAGLNPTVHLGGNLPTINGNIRIGDKKIFVTEACEYRKSFLSLYPSIGVVLNVEPEHLECYGGKFKNIVKAFNKFASQSQKVICSTEAPLQAPITFSDTNLSANFCALNKKLLSGGNYAFTVYKNGSFYSKIVLSVVGKYNITNALACIAVCDNLGVDKEIITNSLRTFKGVLRRYELLGTLGRATYIHDYAHHPTELNSVITSSLEYIHSKSNLVVVFQPHTYSRTKALKDDFIKTLSNLKIYKLAILPTYAAREKPSDGISGEELANELKRVHPNVQYILSNEEYKQFLINQQVESNLVLILGAGDIYSTTLSFKLFD